MSTEQIIQSWEKGIEPYLSETPIPTDHASRNGQATRVIVLPCGRNVTLGEYVRSWRILKGLPAETNVDRWEWYPVSASRILSAIRYGIHDRINKRAGVLIPDMQTPERQRRFFNRASKRANVNCKYCGTRIEYSNRFPRTCGDCQ